jgi:hypothetical protein
LCQIAALTLRSKGVQGCNPGTPAYCVRLWL